MTVTVKAAQRTCAWRQQAQLGQSHGSHHASGSSEEGHNTLVELQAGGVHLVLSWHGPAVVCCHQAQLPRAV